MQLVASADTVRTCIGQTRYTVDPLTVRLPTARMSDVDGKLECQPSDDFTYLAALVSIVRQMHMVNQQRKAQGTPPAQYNGFMAELTQLGESLEAWYHALPPHLAAEHPPDGSSAKFLSNFAGNLHSYYCLSVIMLHRVQLPFFDSTVGDGFRKHHMLLAYEAAKRQCSTQEGIIREFGVSGMRCMQRGMNFAIYNALQCITVYLASVSYLPFPLMCYALPDPVC